MRDTVQQKRGGRSTTHCTCSSQTSHDKEEREIGRDASSTQTLHDESDTERHRPFNYSEEVRSTIPVRKREGMEVEAENAELEAGDNEPHVRQRWYMFNDARVTPSTWLDLESIARGDIPAHCPTVLSYQRSD